MFKVADDNLEVHIDAKECRVPDEVRARMLPRLEAIGRLSHDFGPCPLWLPIVHRPRTSVYHAQAKLKLPGETIITGEHNASIEAALERCLGKVASRIHAAKAEPNREAMDRAQREAALARDIVAPVEPDAGPLGKAVMEGDYEAFRRAFLTHEEWVRQRVGRWIQRYPDVEEQIGASLKIADLVEEVFLLAFEQYPDRPTHISFREWLEQLIDPAIKDFWRKPEDRQAASYAQTLVGRTG
jgi:ribosome-associated translation inhibitor RaiA